MDKLMPLLQALLPSMIKLAQDLFAQQHPGEPVPTSAQVIAGFNLTIATSLSKDDAWDAAHPKA